MKSCDRSLVKRESQKKFLLGRNLEIPKLEA